MCSCDFGKGLRTEHCPSCHATFTATTAGDMHRVGKHHVSTGPDRRRCLTVDEMMVKGMTQNALGHWMGPSEDFLAVKREARKGDSGTAGAA